MLVECKWGDESPGKGLVYLRTRFPACEAWQVSCTGKADYVSRDGIRVCPAARFLERFV